MKFTRVKKILTGDNDPENLMIPIWKDYDYQPEIKPRYVYYTTLPGNSKKGPYLHTKRRGLLTLIEGRILFVYQEEGKFVEKDLEAKEEAVIIDIPKGLGYMLINENSETAKLINICDYPWIQGDKETEKPDFGGYNERIK